MAIKIIVATDSASDTEQWCVGFKQVFTDVQFFPWSDDGGTIAADYAIVWNPPAVLFARERQLKAVFNLGAGVDSLVKLPDLPEQLPVVRLENAGMAQQMVEYVVHALLRASRQFQAYEDFQQAASWTTLPAIDRREWPVGVMGMGVLGAQAAQAIARLGYPVAGWARRPGAVDGVQTYSGPEQWPAFLARTRVLVNVLPLTATTENILDRQNLGRLKPNAVLINVGRGQHLVDDDLLEALDSGAMAGAVLDVFRTEPLPAGHPFWRHPKIVVTPHISAITQRQDAIEQITGKIRALEQGKPISGIVCKSLGY